jgi:hypothetical protein
MHIDGYTIIEVINKCFGLLDCGARAGILNLPIFLIALFAIFFVELEHYPDD